MGELEETLRRLTLGDDRLLGTILADTARCGGPGGLDPRTFALVKLGALIAMDAAPTCFAQAASEGFACGASADDLVDTLVAVAPLVGSAHVVGSAPKLALALGYDVEAALEDPAR
jgi:4-carboxymuconolactone decarboxylase